MVSSSWSKSRGAPLNKRYHHLDLKIACFQLLPLGYLTPITVHPVWSSGLLGWTTPYLQSTSPKFYSSNVWSFETHRSEYRPSLNCKSTFDSPENFNELGSGSHCGYKIQWVFSFFYLKICRVYVIIIFELCHGSGIKGGLHLNYLGHNAALTSSDHTNKNIKYSAKYAACRAVSVPCPALHCQSLSLLL